MTALLADPVYKLHLTGEGHPERPARYDVAVGALERAGLRGKLGHVPVRRASMDEVALCHTAAYIRTVEADFAHGASALCSDFQPHEPEREGRGRTAA
jgi:acetoin utilization deacetylase AcuC-like enzyme